MAYRRAALKSIRSDRKRRLRNRMVKSRLRTEQNKFERLLGRGQIPEAEAQLSVLTKLLQRAGDRRIVPANRAAHRQALCQRRLNRARTATPAPGAAGS